MDGAQAGDYDSFMATLLFDPSMSALPSIERHNVISAQCSECQGGWGQTSAGRLREWSSYGSLNVAKCLVIHGIPDRHDER